jgi:hypothetical protein
MHRILIPSRRVATYLVATTAATAALSLTALLMTTTGAVLVGSPAYGTPPPTEPPGVEYTAVSIEGNGLEILGRSVQGHKIVVYPSASGGYVVEDSVSIRVGTGCVLAPGGKQATCQALFSYINVFGSNRDDSINTTRTVVATNVQAYGGNDIVAIGGAPAPDNTVSTLSGGEGADAITGGRGVDLIDGGPGADRLKGSAGNDRIIGGTGNDVLFGGAGDDRLLGHDAVSGRAGDFDEHWCGGNNDTAEYAAGLGTRNSCETWKELPVETWKELPVS